MKHLWLPLLATFHMFLLLPSYLLLTTSYFLDSCLWLPASFFPLLPTSYFWCANDVLILILLLPSVFARASPPGFESRISCKYPRIAAKTVSVRSSKDGTCLRLHARYAHTVPPCHTMQHGEHKFVQLSCCPDPSHSHNCTRHDAWMSVLANSVLPLLYASSILTPLHDPVVARWLRSCVTERVLKKNLAKPTLDISSGHIKKWKGTFCQIIPQKKIWAKSRLGSANKPLRRISMEEHWVIWQRVIPSSSLQGNAAMQIQHWNLIAFLETQDPPRSWV